MPWSNCGQDSGEGQEMSDVGLAVCQDACACTCIKVPTMHHSYIPVFYYSAFSF